MHTQEMKKEVTNRIIEALENGVAPWRKTWSEAATPMPRNGHTGRAYSGVNTILLLLTAINNGYSTPYWFTTKQANDRDAKVKPGSKGTRIYLFKPLEVKAKDKNKNPIYNDDGTRKYETIPFFRPFTLFNAYQIEGLDESFYQPAEHEPIQQGERRPDIDAFIANTGANIIEGGGNPAFVPGGDFITMPRFNDFEHPEGFYSTVFHELAHWTKTPSRLNRELRKSYGSEGKAMEELVAEITACFCCHYHGINTDFTDNGPAYIASWLKALRDDHSAFYDAVKDADAAFDFLNSFQGEPESKAA